MKMALKKGFLSSSSLRSFSKSRQMFLFFEIIIKKVSRIKKPEKSLLIVLVAYLFSGYRARKLKPKANLIAFCTYRRKKVLKGCA
tara:strand:- start:3062 stop:3316 length:255 start_codon:yes stop_codon:yes gene_type:complete